MKFNWQNKVVIITGSNAGLGKVLAILLGKKGAKIVLNGRNESRLKNTLSELTNKGIEAIAITGDISSYKDCEKIINQTIQAFGQIDVLINNAGTSSVGDFFHLSVDVFKQIIEINYLGAVNMSKAALPYMEKTKGSLFFIGSVAGIHGIGGSSTYSSTKMALTGLAESLNIELKSRGIHVGIAYPGFIENDNNKAFLDKDGNTISVPSREKIKQMPKEQVAGKIIRMIEKRKFKSVFSTLGKSNAIINRFFPSLLHKILSNIYSKTEMR